MAQFHLNSIQTHDFNIRNKLDILFTLTLQQIGLNWGKYKNM